MSSNDWGEGSSYYGWGMPNALFNYMYNLEKVVHDAESETNYHVKRLVRSLVT